MHDLAVAVRSREAGRLNLKVGDLKVRFRVLSHTSSFYFNRRSIYFASKTHCCGDDINVDVYVLRGLRLLTKTAAAVNIRYSHQIFTVLQTGRRHLFPAECPAFWYIISVERYSVRVLYSIRLIITSCIPPRQSIGTDRSKGYNRSCGSAGW